MCAPSIFSERSWAASDAATIIGTCRRFPPWFPTLAPDSPPRPCVPPSTLIVATTVTTLRIAPATCATSDTGPPWSGVVRQHWDALLPGSHVRPVPFFRSRVFNWTNPDNIPLPCVLNGSATVATCKCPVFEGGSYVNMPGILNLGAFYETVAVCGSNGSNCKNLSNCPNGDCDDSIPVAPVCKYISGQDPNDPESSFIPVPISSLRSAMPCRPTIHRGPPPARTSTERAA